MNQKINEKSITSKELSSFEFVCKFKHFEGILLAVITGLLLILMHFCSGELFSALEVVAVFVGFNSLRSFAYSAFDYQQDRAKKSRRLF